MSDYGHLTSLLGFETPVQSPSSEINHQEMSYDIDSLLASLSQSSILTPAASPETVLTTGNGWSLTADSVNSITPVNQFTSSATEQFGLVDSTSYPELSSSETTPVSESNGFPSELDLIYNLLLSDVEASTAEQSTEIDGSHINQVDIKSGELCGDNNNSCKQAASGCNVHPVHQNTDRSQEQAEVDPFSFDKISDPSLEKSVQPNDTWNSEPLQPLFDLGIIDTSQDDVLETSNGIQTVISSASKQAQAMVPTAQQAEPISQPTIQFFDYQQQSNESNYLNSVCDKSQSISQHQKLTTPQQMQFIVTQLPRSPVNDNLSLQNMINAVQRKKVLHASKLDSSTQILKELQPRTMIPVVSFSRDQLTVIPENVKPTPQQPAMSCAQLFSSFSFLSPDEDSSQSEDIMVIEEHISEQEVVKPSLKRAFVEIQNQYILNSNGTDQAFAVQEVYEVIAGAEPIVEESFQQPPRKRQRRINIDYGTDFQCVPCGKTFGKKGSLEQHNRSYHTAEVRPWHCDTCGKNFATEESLGRHVANHDDRNKKFQCTACEKRYVHWKDCERHYQSSHGTPAFRCGQCGKAFVRRDHLLAHEVSHGRRQDREMRRELKIPKRGGIKLNKF